MTRCLFCPADGPGPSWTVRTLAVPVTFRSAFLGAHDDAAVTPAGVYDICRACARWLPYHRSAPLPRAITESLDAGLDAADLHPATRRQARSELIGWTRFVASQLTEEKP